MGDAGGRIMSAPESSRLPSLERLRKEAKKLVRACRAGDAEAVARVRAGSSPLLADVQRALAREHGFANWADLKREILARSQLEFAFTKAGEPPHALASPGIARLLRQRGFVPAE